MLINFSNLLVEFKIKIYLINYLLFILSLSLIINCFWLKFNNYFIAIKKELKKKFLLKNYLFFYFKLFASAYIFTFYYF